MEQKPIWSSKTIWLNTAVALAGLLALWGVVPGVKDWLDGNNELVLTAIGAIGVGLRMITKGKVVIE